MTTDPQSNIQHEQGDIDAFLNGKTFAVVGASADRTKYGNKVLRAYLEQGVTVYPINPRGGEIEGVTAYADLASLPELPHGVWFVTPPAVTEQVAKQAVALGIRHLWMQPGAESEQAVSHARENGVNVVSEGACALVVANFQG